MAYIVVIAIVFSFLLFIIMATELVRISIKQKKAKHKFKKRTIYSDQNCKKSDESFEAYVENCLECFSINKDKVSLESIKIGDVLEVFVNGNYQIDELKVIGNSYKSIELIGRVVKKEADDFIVNLYNGETVNVWGKNKKFFPGETAYLKKTCINDIENSINYEFI